MAKEKSDKGSDQSSADQAPAGVLQCDGQKTVGDTTYVCQLAQGHGDGHVFVS